MNNEKFARTTVTHTHTHTSQFRLNLNYQSSLSFLLALVFIIGSWSCEKNPINDSRETFKFGDVIVPVEKGMLHFQSKNDFQLVIDGIVDGKFHPEKSGVHFTAMERFFNDIPAEIMENMDQELIDQDYSEVLTIVHEGEDAYLKPVVDSRPLRSLINTNGNMVIGDTLYHFGYNKTYLLPKSRFTNTKNIESMAVKTYDVKRQSGNNSVLRSVINCVDYYGGKKRKQQRKMKGELWDYNNGLYQEISVGVENYDKNFAHIWKRDDATNIWLQGNFTVEYYDYYQGWVTISDNINEYRFHEDEIEVIIISRYNDGNTLGNVYWDGTDMDFIADEKDDSEVRHDGNWDEAQCNITE